MILRSSLAVANIVLAACPAFADQTWAERHTNVVQCESIRNAALALVDKWNGKLWYASTDNSRDGFLNPTVVIDARQRVQDMVQAYDWYYSHHIRSAPIVNVQACKEHAMQSGLKIATYIDGVLKSATAR